MLPYKAIDAASATGVGAVRDLERIATGYTIQLVLTGSPTEVDLILQGSLDGANWYELARASQSDLVQTDNFADSLSGGRRGARYLRANLGTLNGGTSPTVTAWVGVSD